LREQGHEAGAEAETDDEERRDARRVVQYPAIGEEDARHTMRLSDTTRKPDTAPPRKETVIASLRLRVAAEAQRALERTEIYIPMYPDSAEAAAPTRKAML